MEKSTLIRIVAWMTIPLISVSCRFGNRVEKTEQDLSPNPDADTISGYYETRLQSLKLCASLNPVDGVTDPDPCGTADLDLTPIEPVRVYTNPLILLVKNAQSGLAQLANEAYTYGFDVYFEKAGSLAYSKSDGPATFWFDHACLLTVGLDITGKFVPATEKKYSASGRLLSGSVQLSHQIVRTFDGDCTLTFQAGQACYQDPTQCGQEATEDNLALQSQWQKLLNPYLTSGRLRVEDIERIKALSYEVNYQ